MSTEEKKQSYGIVILRRDGEHIAVSESNDYDKMFELHKELTGKWTSCIKDNIPFTLTSPLVTSFDPGLIYEIKLNPVVETTASKYDNPYNREMHNKGLSGMQNKYRVESDLQDHGYR